MRCPEGLAAAIDQRVAIAQEYRWRYLGLVEAVDPAFANDVLGEGNTVVEIGPAVHPRGSLQGFLPVFGAQVISVDQSYTHLSATTTDKGKVVADAQELPLIDESVDAIFSTDVLEHVEPENRKKIFLESARVLRPGGIVVCGFPTGDIAGTLDRWLNDRYVASHGGEPHPYLVEHLANGLPGLDQVLEDLESVGLQIKKVQPNANWLFWKADACAQSEILAARHPVVSRGVKFASALLSQVLILTGLIDRGGTYRQIVVAQKPTTVLE